MLRQALIPPGSLILSVRCANGFTRERRRIVLPVPHPSKPIILHNSYHPPFNWSALLQFLHSRATPQEWVTENAYHRLINGHQIIVANVPVKNCLSIQIPPGLSYHANIILCKTRTLFDLDANPHIIEAGLSRDLFLHQLIVRHPGLRVPGCWDNFELLLRVIIGQQISVPGATTTMRRLVDRIGVTPENIAASSPEAIAAIGMPLKRATTILRLAYMVRSGVLDLHERDPELFYQQLVTIPGIGPWTAEYMCMRALHWPDAFPAGDLGLQKAVMPGQRQTERQLIARASEWKPWRSYATMLLWKSLENQGG
jgi:AraC family transcriptional regulator, regulatory protein of adaptative response / DNA-3-methyladenine glycosylase II